MITSIEDLVHEMNGLTRSLGVIPSNTRVDGFTLLNIPSDVLIEYAEKNNLNLDHPTQDIPVYETGLLIGNVPVRLKSSEAITDGLIEAGLAVNLNTIGK